MFDCQPAVRGAVGIRPEHGNQPAMVSLGCNEECLPWWAGIETNHLTLSPVSQRDHSRPCQYLGSSVLTASELGVRRRLHANSSLQTLPPIDRHAPIRESERELGTTPPPLPAYADRSGEAGRCVSGHKDEQERQGKAGRSS